jgi:hypothetical protein
VVISCCRADDDFLALGQITSLLVPQPSVDTDNAAVNNEANALRAPIFAVTAV